MYIFYGFDIYDKHDEYSIRISIDVKNINDVYKYIIKNPREFMIENVTSLIDKNG